MNNLTGYRIFYRYLDELWNTEAHDWLGTLLGGMSFLPDGSTGDPAYESDWDDAAAKCADPDDPYQIGIQFLKDWLAIGYIEEIGQICRDMEEKKHPDLWKKQCRMCRTVLMTLVCDSRNKPKNIQGHKYKWLN